MSNADRVRQQGTAVRQKGHWVEEIRGGHSLNALLDRLAFTPQEFQNTIPKCDRTFKVPRVDFGRNAANGVCNCSDEVSDGAHIRGCTLALHLRALHCSSLRLTASHCSHCTSQPHIASHYITSHDVATHCTTRPLTALFPSHCFLHSLATFFGLFFDLVPLTASHCLCMVASTPHMRIKCSLFCASV